MQKNRESASLPLAIMMFCGVNMPFSASVNSTPCRKSATGR